MPYLDYNDVRNAALSQRLAPRSLGPRASFGEAFSAGMDAAVLGQIAPSEFIARRRATLENLDALRQHSDGMFPDLDSEIAAATARAPGTTPDIAGAYEEVVQAKVRQLLEQRPELADKFSPDIQTRAYEITREAEERANEVAARSGTIGDIGALSGSLAAFIYDPITYAGLLVGGAPTAGRSALAAVGAVAKREAAIGFAGEAAAQPIVQEYRDRAGLDAGFWLGVQNAVLAGVSSAALAGVVKGATRGGAKLYEVAGEVMHRYRTDPEFRAGLTPAEREAFEANDRDAAEMGHAAHSTDRVPDAEAVRAAVAETTEALQAGIPLRRLDLDPLATRAGYAPPEIPFRRLLDGILPESVIRDMDNAQRGTRRAVMTSERALASGQIQAIARNSGILERQAGELSLAQQARVAVDEELDAVNEALARLRRGEAPEDASLLARMLDPETTARLEQIATDLEQTGLTRKARTRLEDEQLTVIQSVADEVTPQLERRADELVEARTSRVSEEQDLRDALRALRRGKDPASRRRTADTKARHERILAAGRAPDAADIDTFPAGLTPYRAREVAKMEQHTAAVEARVNNEPAVAQRAESRIDQEVEAAPDRAVLWGGEAKTLRAVQDELERQQTLADLIKGCRGG